MSAAPISVSKSQASTAGSGRILFLTDTHAAADGVIPNVLFPQAQWVAANYQERKIQLIAHGGDLTTTPTAGERTIAVTGFAPLIGLSAPTVFVPGNHDYADYATRDLTAWNAAFPPSRMSGLQEAFEVGSSANTFSLVTIGGVQYVVLGLEFGPRDAVVTWADGILAANAAKPAIVITHSYLGHDGQISDHANNPTGSYPPQNYALPAGPGISDGKALWDNLIEPAGNVMLVLSGHEVLDAYAYVAGQRSASAMYPTCHQLMMDHQQGARTPDTCGNPFATEIDIDTANNRLSWRTFSASALLNEMIAAETASVPLR